MIDINVRIASIAFIRLSEFLYPSILESRYKPAVTTERERERERERVATFRSENIVYTSRGVTIVPLVPLPIPTHTHTHRQPYRLVESPPLYKLITVAVQCINYCIIYTLHSIRVSTSGGQICSSIFEWSPRSQRKMRIPTPTTMMFYFQLEIPQRAVLSINKYLFAFFWF